MMNLYNASSLSAGNLHKSKTEIRVPKGDCEVPEPSVAVANLTKIFPARAVTIRWLVRVMDFHCQLERVV